MPYGQLIMETVRDLTMFYKADERNQVVRDSGFRYFVRETWGNDPMKLIGIVEEHFGFN